MVHRFEEEKEDFTQIEDMLREADERAELDDWLQELDEDEPDDSEMEFPEDFIDTGCEFYWEE